MQNARSASQGSAAKAAPSIEDVRRRARHRLIGAAVLVLLGVVGFSLLFDSQPRPLPVDIPIVIPSKNAPAVAAPAGTTAKPASAGKSAPAAPAAPVAASDSLDAREEVVKPGAAAPAKTEVAVTAKPASKPAEKPADKPVEKAPAKTAAVAEPKPEAKVAAKTAPAQSDADRARALLNGQTAAKSADKPAAAALRLVVQVGAFADVARAREVRLKLERAGLKTYTNVAETSQGRRIRVRVGPFSTQAEADKAAARVKALGLPAAILTL